MTKLDLKMAELCRHNKWRYKSTHSEDFLASYEQALLSLQVHVKVAWSLQVSYSLTWCLKLSFLNSNEGILI